MSRMRERPCSGFPYILFLRPFVRLFPTYSHPLHPVCSGVIWICTHRSLGGTGHPGVAVNQSGAWVCQDDLPTSASYTNHVFLRPQIRWYRHFADTLSDLVLISLVLKRR